MTPGVDVRVGVKVAEGEGMGVEVSAPRVSVKVGVGVSVWAREGAAHPRRRRPAINNRGEADILSLPPPYGSTSTSHSRTRSGHCTVKSLTNDRLDVVTRAR